MKRLAIMLAVVPMVWAQVVGPFQAFAAEDQNRQTGEVTVCETPTEYGAVDLTTGTVNLDIPVLSLEFLEDTWVNENGFVCSYEKNVFYFDRDQILTDCTVTKTGIQGTNAMIMESVKSNIPIEVLSQDSIKVNGTTAYRSGSETGKSYLTKIQDLLKGEWFMADMEGMIEEPVTITDHELKVMDEKEPMTFTYKFENSSLIVTDTDNTASTIRVQMINQDRFLISNILITANFFRKGSKEYENYQDMKDEFLVGTWIYACADRTKSEKWEITKDKITCTSFKKNAKSKEISYQVKCDGEDTLLMMGNKTYTVETLFNVTYLNGVGDETYKLIPYDSEVGKHELKNTKIANNNGKMEKRSYVTSVPDDFIKKARINLTCKNNIVLEDAVTFGSFNKELIDKSCLGCLLMSYDDDLKYKKASLTMQYDPKKLGKVKESNLVVGYYKNNKIVLLKTKVNKKNHTVTAVYHGGSQYFILDKAKYKKK